MKHRKGMLERANGEAWQRCNAQSCGLLEECLDFIESGESCVYVKCNSPPACKVCPVGPHGSAPPLLQSHDRRWTQWPLHTWGGGCLPPHDLDVGSTSSPKIFPESDSLLRSSACYSTYAWRLASPIDCIAEKRSANVKSVGIVPRHKPQNAQVGGFTTAVVINWDSIKPLFGMPLCDAAKSLGISFTSLKTICRRLGLERWPYKRPCQDRVRSMRRQILKLERSEKI